MTEVCYAATVRITGRPIVRTVKQPMVCATCFFCIKACWAVWGGGGQWLDGSVLPEGSWVLQGVELTRLSAVINALVMAGLVWAGALSFKRVVKSKSAQLVYCMQVGGPHAVARLMASVELTAG